MALNPTVLSGALQAAFANALASPHEMTQTEAIQHLSDAIAGAMVSFVSSASVLYTAGLSSPSGPVIGVSGMVLS